MVTKTMITILAFGTSALALNASLVLDKFDPGYVVDGRSLKDNSIPSSLSPSLRETNLHQDNKVESISIDSELVAMPEASTLLAGTQFNRHRDGRIESTSTMSELMAISDLREGMTASQIAERAAVVTVPEPSTLLAGALLLLPLLGSTMRTLRRNKMGQPKWLNASAGR